MPADFVDTSALAKHYHAEVGSAEVDLTNAISKRRAAVVSTVSSIAAISSNV